MKRLSQTFKLSLAAFLGVFSSGLIQLYTAPTALAYPGTGNGTLHHVVCHAEGNGSWHGIPPAQTSNHIDPETGLPYQNGIHVRDFLIYAEYPADMAWNDLSKEIKDSIDLECAKGPVVSTVNAPTFTDICELTNDKYTIPSTDYVQYKVNGAVTAAGTYPVTQAGPVTITAETLLQHTFAEGVTTSWEHTFTNEPCTKPVYYLETSNQTTCGQITISLRNVSPWMYRVLIEEKNDNGDWVRVGATTGDTKWQAAPGVMIVDNRGEAPDDQTGSYIVQFAEDSGNGLREVRYRVSSGAEDDLYLNLPVGTFQTVTVDTDCVEPEQLPSEANWLQTACVAGTNTTDLLEIVVINTKDESNLEVTYTVTITPEIGAAITKQVTVADGEESTVVFENLPAGEYVIDISATDETEFESEYVTIDQCTVTPGSGSGNGHTLGGATDVKTPTVLPTTALPTSLPATGADGTQNQLVIVLAALTAYGATFFFQNRRKLSANEA